MNLSAKAWAGLSLVVLIIVLSSQLMLRSESPVGEEAQPAREAFDGVAGHRQDPTIPDTSARAVDPTLSLKQYSDEELVGYGINPDMREWAFRFLANRQDSAFLQEFFLLRRGSSDDGTNCLQVAMPDGQLIDHCDERSAHDYFNYDSASLEQLALADAVAAQVLGHRYLYVDPVAAETYFLRAVALSGKPGPIVHYLGLRTGLESDPETGQFLSEKAALRAYTLAVVVEKVGYPLLIARNYRSVLEERGVSADAIRAAEAESREVMEWLEETRNALIGGNLCTGKERYV